MDYRPYSRTNHALSHSCVHLIWVSGIVIQVSFVLRKNAHLSYANSVDHDQMPGFAASGPDMHRLPFSLSGPQGINKLRCSGFRHVYKGRQLL